MGHYNSGSNSVIQTINGATAGYFGSPAYFNSAVYYSGQGDHLDRYTLTKGVLSKTPASKSPKTLAAGGTPSVSANGTANGIVWVIDASSKKGSTAVLHAYKASNVATELYNSQQDPSRDTLGKGIRFSVPTIANGNVYVGNQSSLFIFGLL
jgi:hypothetical protein